MSADQQSPPLKMEADIDRLLRQSNVIKEYQKVAARLLFHYYEELKRAGFMDAQAMIIVASHGYIPKVSGGGNE